jgi:hypothetical protein
LKPFLDRRQFWGWPPTSRETSKYVLRVPEVFV